MIFGTVCIFDWIILIDFLLKGCIILKMHILVANMCFTCVMYNYCTVVHQNFMVFLKRR